MEQLFKRVCKSIENNSLSVETSVMGESLG